MSDVSWVCPDASLIVRLLVPGPDSDKAEDRWASWTEDQLRPAAPTLIGYEVTNALRRYSAVELLLPEEVKAALDAYTGLAIEVFHDTTLHYRAVELATEFDLPAAYDAHYLALAERLEADFWTADRKLIERLGGRVPWVHLL